MRPPAPRGAEHQDARPAIVRPHLARAHLDCQRLPGMSETEPDLETAAKLKTHGDRYEMLARARPGVWSRQRGSGRSGIGKADLPRQQQTMAQRSDGFVGEPVSFSTSERAEDHPLERIPAEICGRCSGHRGWDGRGRSGHERPSALVPSQVSPGRGMPPQNTIWCVATP